MSDSDVETILTREMRGFVDEEGEGDTVNEEDGLVIATAIGSDKSGGDKRVHDDSY